MATPVPFADGPPRPKQVISLGFFRTGSQSLKEALTILGLKDVFHTSVIARDVSKWVGLGLAADNNIACIPSYTGRTYTRADWDTYFGPCEALTDVTPFAEPLLHAYPEARVILVHRDFESWAESFQRTLVDPSSASILSRWSATVFEPAQGIAISQTLWKLYLGLLGVCDIRKTRNRTVMRAGYDRHYANVRRLVPPERLLELDLKDMGWEPLCKFLDKDVPDVPFPRLNESRVFQNEFKALHRLALLGFVVKIVGPILAVVAAGVWMANASGYL